MPRQITTEKISSGLKWPEAPRWRNGCLWVSDVHGFQLVALSLEGERLDEINVPQRPSGFDISSSGKGLLATGLTKQLLNVDLENGTTEPAIELGHMVTGVLNDLTIAPSGWAFVGDTGFLFGVDDPVENGKIIAYHSEFGVRIAAENVFFPNGMVITPDGKTLFISETFGRRISTFDLSADGTLSNRRVFAEVPGNPDGLALDAKGGLWVPLLFEDKFVRLDKTGMITDEILTDGLRAISCVAGGPTRDHLFLGVARLDTSDPDNPIRNGEIHRVKLDVQGAGYP